MRKKFAPKRHLLIKILALMLLIILNIIFFYVESVITTNNYEFLLNQSMTQELTVVEDFFRYPENIINILSQNKDLPLYDKDNRLLRNSILLLFESIIVPDSRISNIYFLSNSGEKISYIFEKKHSDNFENYSWFDKVLKGKTQFTWISHKSDFSSDDVISCLRRVVDKYNNPVGVVGLDIELFKLSQLVQNTKVGQKGYFMILDSNNKIIASMNNKSLGQRVTNKNFINAVKNDDNNSFKMKIDNEEFKCKLAHVEKLPWKILNVVPVSEITANIRNSIVLFILFSSASFTIVLLLYLKNETTQTLNKKLESANDKVMEYAVTVEEIAILQERNRLARDVHDTLGQTLSILLTLLQVSVLSCKGKCTEVEKNLNNAINITREGLNEVRRSITELVSGKWAKRDLFDSLEKMISDFECTGINIELSVNKFEKNIEDAYKEVIFRICQEALTNSVKHGKATEASIIIKFNNNTIRLFIFDNGLGCKDKVTFNGMGLLGMKSRVKKLNGSIKFGSEIGYGFNINVELPLNKVKEAETYDKSCVS